MNLNRVEKLLAESNQISNEGNKTAFQTKIDNLKSKIENIVINNTTNLEKIKRNK